MSTLSRYEVIMAAAFIPAVQGWDHRHHASRVITIPTRKVDAAEPVKGIVAGRQMGAGATLVRTTPARRWRTRQHRKG